MPEYRHVLAILAYNDNGPPPDRTDFADVMMGGRASLKRYWDDNAAGVVAIERFELAGPYKVSLPALTKAYGAEAPREQTIERARQAAADAGIDVRRFDAIVVMLHPAVYVDGSGASLGYDVGANGNGGCLLPFSETGTYFAHELGHALGFVHSHGIPTTAGDWIPQDGIDVLPVYGNPYGMMSAQTFGGAEPRMATGTPFAGYPSAHLVGPMLARAELYHDKPAHMDAAGLVIHLQESGTSTATVVTAGTGGSGRPELAVYGTTGGGTIFVELRAPGSEADRNWWDGGLELGVDNERDAPGLVVHCLTNPAEGPTVTYAARLVMPGPDADTTFDTPDGRFTLRVQDSQQALPGQVTFRLQRGSLATSVMVREDAVESVTVVGSELRTHPRFPDLEFTWEVRDVRQSVTYTPTVLGIGVGWPEPTQDERFNTQVLWNTDTVVELTPPGGTTGSVTWTLDDATSVLTLSHGPGSAAVSLPLHATAYDVSVAGQQTPRDSSSTTFNAVGRTEGWGADFYAFLTTRLGELIHRSMPVFGDDEGAEQVVAEIKDTFRLLRDDRPDLANQLAVDVRRREQQLTARPDLAARLQLGIPDLTIPELTGYI